ncbi:MAG: hypothetical protein ACRD1Z_00875, partial [Vicinamibacteria bacterium]
MGRPKKRKENEEDPELERIAQELQATGGGAEYFLEIRRRIPGQIGYFPIWKKKQAAADVVGVEDFCRTHGGPEYEYMVTLKDAALKTVYRNGLPVVHRVEAVTSPPAGSPLPSNFSAKNPAISAEIEGKRIEANRLRAEADAATDLARAKREHERAMKAIEAGQLEDDTTSRGRPGRPEASQEWP